MWGEISQQSHPPCNPPHKQQPGACNPGAQTPTGSLRSAQPQRKTNWSTSWWKSETQDESYRKTEGRLLSLHLIWEQFHKHLRDIPIAFLKIIKSGSIYEEIYFLVAQLEKNLPAMRETWIGSLGWEDPLEKGMANHSSILENVMVRGPRRATVHGVAKSQTWLSNFHFPIVCLCVKIWQNVHWKDVLPLFLC